MDNLFTGGKLNIEHPKDHPRFEIMRHDPAQTTETRVHGASAYARRLRTTTPTPSPCT